MLKLVFLSALAAAVVATVAGSSTSAASLPTNLSTGHIAVSRPTNNFDNTNIGASNQYFTPNGHGPKLKPKVETDRGGCHTKANSIQRCWDGPNPK